MPSDQYPENRDARYRCAHSIHPQREKGRIKPPAEGLRPGAIAYGTYMSANRLTHRGIGRAVRARVDQSGHFLGFAMYESLCLDDISPAALPRSAYSGSATTQANENPARPRRKETFGLSAWYGGLRRPGPKKEQPALGAEAAGVYFAPDGQWFAGVGRVVAVGNVDGLPGSVWTYIFVEPIPGKTGCLRDYDFFHPVTLEWMDELPSNPIPGWPAL
ncbi:hypothetical protein BDW74DRAFT_179559 [Aspergillus multicolor]|uniref:uncharacterized protein n=1 Tax=Aspergillus multicolor TaxID=41759 RepID=UPI003CCE2172